jgi:hypothetical protein
MNFAPHVPWYRRVVFGDRWPNNTSWKLLEAEICGAWLIVERHTKGCNCSYCRGEHGHKLFWMPGARGWRVVNLFHRFYMRWVPHSRGAEPHYSKAANYQVPESLPHPHHSSTTINQEK